MKRPGKRPLVLHSGFANVKFGDRVKVVRPANLYGCEIGDDSFIGPFVEIQQGAVIGSRCRVQSHAFICDMVMLGDDCFISHGVMFVNDPFLKGGPAKGDRSLYRGTRVGPGVSIGTNATILPVSIVGGCVIGAGSVVTKDLKIKGVYAGNPAKLLRRLR